MNLNNESVSITSIFNTKVKDIVKLRKRSVRDSNDKLVVEGYRELNRALDNNWQPESLFLCKELFLGENEGRLVERFFKANSKIKIYECSVNVFNKISYSDRPDGLLSIGPQKHTQLKDLKIKTNLLILVAEAIEKPGNLGTMIRTADAAGVDAVIVCDHCTDINNPAVIRSSIGTFFSLPIVEVSTDEAIKWFKTNNIQIVAATPHANLEYTQLDMTKSTAIIVGSEQYGLDRIWFQEADEKIVIPMLGQGDSLNVSAAATILLYEAVRQRRGG